MQATDQHEQEGGSDQGGDDPDRQFLRLQQGAGDGVGPDQEARPDQGGDRHNPGMGGADGPAGDVRDDQADESNAARPAAKATWCRNSFKGGGIRPVRPS